MSLLYYLSIILTTSQITVSRTIYPNLDFSDVEDFDNQNKLYERFALCTNPGPPDTEGNQKCFFRVYHWEKSDEFPYVGYGHVGYINSKDGPFGYTTDHKLVPKVVVARVEYTVTAFGEPAVVHTISATSTRSGNVVPLTVLHVDELAKLRDRIWSGAQ